MQLQQNYSIATLSSNTLGDHYLLKKSLSSNAQSDSDKRYLLTHDQTRYIFETNTIGVTDESINVDDIIEATNHFRCIDLILDRAEENLSETFIKELHNILKSGTSDSRKDWFAVGDYKRLPNEVGGADTTLPENVHKEMKALLKAYNSKKQKSFDDILDWHYCFEAIHPFQDGNGRVGRLILFKECLANGYVPFIITENDWWPR